MPKSRKLAALCNEAATAPSIPFPWPKRGKHQKDDVDLHFSSVAVMVSSALQIVEDAPPPKSFATSPVISIRAMAATRIQRVTRSTFRFAYSKVYAAAVLTPIVGVPIDYVKGIRSVFYFDSSMTLLLLLFLTIFLLPPPPVSKPL